MISLFFKEKVVYGNLLYYPDCDATRNLALLSKRKTFDYDSLILLANTYCFNVKLNLGYKQFANFTDPAN